VKRIDTIRKPIDRPPAPNGRKPSRIPVRRSVAPSVLKDIIARVVAAARPERIIMFGSAARGTMGRHSDVDLLVIKGGKYDRWSVTDRVYMNMRGAQEAVDIIIVTPEEVERYRDNPYAVICPALREGKIVHGA
jgi:predicted nucleotidyltransferase